MANQLGDYLPFINLGTSRTSVAIFSSSRVLCSILDTSDLKCFGYNINGQLGQGHTLNLGDETSEMGDYLQPVNLPTGHTTGKMVGGYDFTGIISTNGNSLFLWGENAIGQLGLGHTNDIGDNSSEMGNYLQATNLGNGVGVIDYQGGEEQGCALLDDFSMKCFGRNQFGQLGYGDNQDRGDEANEMGEYLPVVNLGMELTVQSIQIGYYHGCAMLNDDSLKCWGRGFNSFVILNDIILNFLSFF